VIDTVTTKEDRRVTNWTSLNNILVTASEGIAAMGEGRVRRIGTTGNTKVVAVTVTTLL
jgi:hypothetical protein